MDWFKLLKELNKHAHKFKIKPDNDVMDAMAESSIYMDETLVLQKITPYAQMQLILMSYAPKSMPLALDEAQENGLIEDEIMEILYGYCKKLVAAAEENHD